jgi:hypothetical protein
MALNSFSKHLWSHVRDVRIDVYQTTIKYTIPVMKEQGSGELGSFIKQEISDGWITLYYKRCTEDPPLTLAVPNK